MQMAPGLWAIARIVHMSVCLYGVNYGTTKVLLGMEISVKKRKDQVFENLVFAFRTFSAHSSLDCNFVTLVSFFEIEKIYRDCLSMDDTTTFSFQRLSSFSSALQSCFVI